MKMSLEYWYTSFLRDKTKMNEKKYLVWLRIEPQIAIVLLDYLTDLRLRTIIIIDSKNY